MSPDSPRILTLLLEQIHTTIDGPCWIIATTLDIKNPLFGITTSALGFVDTDAKDSAFYSRDIPFLRERDTWHPAVLNKCLRSEMNSLRKK